MSEPQPNADEPENVDPNNETKVEEETPTSPWRKKLIHILLILFIGLFLFRTFFNKKDTSAPSDISELLQKIEAGEIASIEVTPKLHEMMLLVATPKEVEAEKLTAKGVTMKPLEYAIPNSELTMISSIAREHGVTYQTPNSAELVSTNPGFWGTFLMLAPLVLFAILVFGRGAMAGGMMSNMTGRLSKSMGFNVQMVESVDTTFDDVAGMKPVKRDLEEIVQFLKDPEPFRKLGARIPRGVLLKGPPGTGKTLIARATAGEAGVPFFSIAGSDFVQMFVGMGAQRVREIFEQVKQHESAIIFIDEIDALGKKRGNSAGQPGGNDEREQTLNALLVEMDGFTANSGVIVMAATNRDEILDPALLRPGRFDRHLDVAPPNQAEREEILGVHVRGLPLAEDADLESIARFTMGFTGADLENLVNEAALFAARRKQTTVSLLDFEDGFNRAIEGVPGTLTLSEPKMRTSTAAHEAGHTGVAFVLKDEALNEPYSTSIKPGVGFLGRMRLLPRTELAHITKRKLIIEMAILYGGRAGELQAGAETDDISAGASDDLRRMTNIAERMVYELGFGKKVGIRVLRDSSANASFYDAGPKPSQIGPEIQKDADDDVAALIEEAEKLAIKVLKENGKFHAAIQQQLEAQEEVRGTELVGLLQANSGPVQAVDAS